MADFPKLFCLVNDGQQLTVYRSDQVAPWFSISANACHGSTPERKAQTFNEVVKFQRVAFGPLAEYKELKIDNLPGM